MSHVTIGGQAPVEAAISEGVPSWCARLVAEDALRAFLHSMSDMKLHLGSVQQEGGYCGMTRFTERNVESALDSFYYTSVTGHPKPGVRTWTYDPRTSMSVTVGPKAALHTALYILGQLVRHPRSSVTFESWSEPRPPVTFLLQRRGPIRGVTHA